MGRYCTGVSGWSVQMAMSTPAPASLAGFSMVMFRSSGLDRSPRLGPVMTGMPSAASNSGSRWPSVPWTMTHFKRNSLAMRTPVAMSSARWAWMWTGSSPRTTGSSASSLRSNSGRSSSSSSSARSSFSPYSRALDRFSRMMAAVAMRVTGVSCRSLYTHLGFSPRAIFMAAGALTIISSTHRPAVLMAANWPLTGLAEPGPVSTVVTPPSRAS